MKLLPDGMSCANHEPQSFPNAVSPTFMTLPLLQVASIPEYPVQSTASCQNDDIGTDADVADTSLSLR